MPAVLLEEIGKVHYIPDLIIKPPRRNWLKWKVLVTGICKTDHHLLHHPVVNNIILGHEVVCYDEQKNFYALNNEIYCKRCEFCKTHKTSHCVSMKELGVTENGGFATEIYAPKSCLVAIKCCDKRAGILIEPVACALHAIQRLKKLTFFKQHDELKVLIQGSGVSGKILAYLLKNLLPKISLFLYDINFQALNWLKKYPYIKALTCIPKENFDLTIECSGTSLGLKSCLFSTVKGGIVMIYGIPPPESLFPITPNQLFKKEINLLTSMAGCDRKTFLEAKNLVEQHESFFSTLLGKTISLAELPEELLNGNPLPGTRTLVDPNI